MVQSKNPSTAVLDALCADQRRRWLQGERVPVESYQSLYAQLLSDRQALLMFIAHEVKLRRNFGEEAQLDSFLDRFPDLELDLVELFRSADQSQTAVPVTATPEDSRDNIDGGPMAETLGYVVTKPDQSSLEGKPAGNMSSWSTVVFDTPEIKRETPGPLAESSPTEPTATSAEPPQKVPAPSPEQPVLFGDYELLERIAHGAMGVVFKARHLRLHRVVAIKMILNSHLAGDEQVRRFYIEAEPAARLEHPGIVAVYDINHHEGRHYIAMQYVQGRSLAEHVKQQNIPQRDAVKIMLQVCESLQYAHDRGVVHRDLKPQNILIAPTGRPIITDFGLAKQMYQSDSVTVTGQIIGTPSYMSPEQASAQTDMVGPHTDVYGLGAVLYYLLTGRPPFHNKSVAEVLRDVLEAPPPSMKGAKPPVPKDLEEICRKCLAKKTSERFATAGALAARLQQYLDTHPPTALDSGGIRDSRWPRIIHPSDLLLPSPTRGWAARVANLRKLVRKVRNHLKQSWDDLGREATARPTPANWPQLQRGGRKRSQLTGKQKQVLLLIGGGAALILVLSLLAILWTWFNAR